MNTNLSQRPIWFQHHWMSSYLSGGGESGGEWSSPQPCGTMDGWTTIIK